MSPFGQALGMNSEEFKPWKKLFGSNSEAIFLVEGETDRKYFEMLRDPVHGINALEFDGEIIAYDGAGTLKHGPSPIHKEPLQTRFCDLRSRHEK